jgi:hypothetical protein
MGSERILGRFARGVWSGFSWLRIGIGGRLLGQEYRTPVGAVTDEYAAMVE